MQAILETAEASRTPDPAIRHQTMKQDETKFDTAHRMIKRGDLLGLREALESGLDPNLKNRYGWTLLMLSALHGRTDMAEVLIAKGADANLVNKFGDSAARLAELKKHKKTKTIVEPAHAGEGIPRAR